MSTPRNKWDHDNRNDPTASQKAALVGTNGTPASNNPYVTSSDPRLGAGSTGPQGPAVYLLNDDGDDGTMGPPGAAGSAGSTGPTGPSGSSGVPGPPGSDGDDGDPGMPGPPGVAGAAGAQGPTGPQGAALYLLNDDGDDGTMGPPGASGPAGPSGAQGPTGPQGAALYLLNDDGDDGAMGPPGIQGPAGAAGGGSVTATTVEVNLGSTPTWAGKFTITDASITSAKKVLVWQAPGPYTNKGSSAGSTDEGSMDPLLISAVVPAAGSATVYWVHYLGLRPFFTYNPGPRRTTLATGYQPLNQEECFAAAAGRVKGNVKFSYLILA